MMIALIWNKVAYVVKGDYWSARKMLNIPVDDIAPWYEYNPSKGVGLECTKRWKPSAVYLALFIA